MWYQMSSKRFENFRPKTEFALWGLAAYRLVSAFSVFDATTLTQNAAKPLGPILRLTTGDIQKVK